VSTFVILKYYVHEQGIGLYLLGIYIIVAAFAVVIVLRGQSHLEYVVLGELTLLPYLVLAIGIITIIYPLIEFGSNLAYGVTIVNLKGLAYFSFFYLLMAVVNLWATMDNVIVVLGLGNFNLIRNMVYSGESIKFYNNFFEYFATIFCQYFGDLALICSFYFFIKGRRSFFLGTVLLLSVIFPLLASSVLVASRGMFVLEIAKVGALYFIFKGMMEKRTRTKLILIFLILLTLGGLLVLSISFSRFGNVISDVVDNAIEYFGQAPLVFNFGLGRVTTHTYGKYSFKPLYEVLGVDTNIDQQAIGARWGTGFITFLGPIALDFGFLGVLLFVTFNFMFIRSLSNKAGKKFYEFYYLVSFIFYLIDGSLVIGSSYLYKIVANLLITAALYVFDRKAK